MLRTVARRACLVAFVLVSAGWMATPASAQFGLFGGGGQGLTAYRGWPGYREARDLQGQGYTDITPTGRRGYFVPLGLPGYDDIGNGPSMAYSPIFNAPASGPRPPAVVPQAEAAPAAAGPRPTGLLRRIFRRK